MADVETVSAFDTTPADHVASLTTTTPPASSTTDLDTTTPASAGDTAAASEKTSARDVWREMQAAESGGTPPDAPPDPSNAKAARQPDGATEAPGSLPTQGPIPLDRHKAVVTRTRNDTRAETLAEYGIADGTPKDDVTTGITLVRMLKQDAHALVRIVQSQLGEGGAPAATARHPESPVEDPEPEPDIPLRDGRAVYSADQLRKWHQWHSRQFMAQVDKAYGPIRETHELQTLQASQKREAKALVGEAAEWPYFDQLRPHIKRLLAAQTTPLTATSLHTAYITAFKEHGLSLARQAWDSERSGQLTRKAHASTVQPGAPRPTTPRPDSELSTREIVRQEWRRAAG